jgi:hypothetical protein
MTDATKTSFGAQPWKDGPLYQFLMDRLPEHRSVCGFLDVIRLARDLKKSHEAVYKWLRTSRLTPANADAIRDLVNRTRFEGLPVLERKDFDAFVYAA